MNIFNGASTQLAWPFNSMCKFAGHIIGSSEDGISTIGGNDFNGDDISAFFELPPTDLNSANKKRIRKTKIGLEASGDLQMTVTFDGGTPYQYPVHPTQNAQHGVRVNNTRDQYGRYFQYRFDNTNGCDFSIDHIDVDVTILQQKQSGGL